MEEKKDDIEVYEDLLSQAFTDRFKYNKAVQLLHSDLLLSDKEACLQEEGQIKDPRERARLLLKALHVEEKPNALIQFLKSDEELKSLAEDISAEVIKPGAEYYCFKHVPCASLITSKYLCYVTPRVIHKLYNMVYILVHYGICSPHSLGLPATWVRPLDINTQATNAMSSCM